MRRSNPGKSKNSSIPPISKDPKVFENAFERAEEMYFRSGRYMSISPSRLFMVSVSSYDEVLYITHLKMKK